MCMMCHFVRGLAVTGDSIAADPPSAGESETEATNERKAGEALSALANALHESDPRNGDAMPGVICEHADTPESRSELMTLVGYMVDTLNSIGQMVLHTKIEQKDEDEQMVRYKQVMRDKSKGLLTLLEGLAGSLGGEVKAVDKDGNVVDMDAVLDEPRGSQTAKKTDGDAAMEALLERRRRRQEKLN